MAIIYTDDRHYKNIANEIRRFRDTDQEFLTSEMSENIEIIRKQMGLAIHGHIMDLVCPEGTYSIGTHFFKDNLYIKACKLNKDIIQIGTEAFYGATLFESIVFPESIQTLKPRCFSNCSNLRTVVFKGTPNEISGSSFLGCSNLRDIYVPWSLGEVAGAPWGAPNANIIYDTDVGEIYYDHFSVEHPDEEESHSYFNWAVGETFRDIVKHYSSYFSIYVTTRGEEHIKYNEKYLTCTYPDGSAQHVEPDMIPSENYYLT